MHTPFFITGFPRSRTAWLANLFTTDQALCFHEPTQSADQLISENSDLNVGVSDAGLVFKCDELLQKYPTAPWLYVERDEECALKSLIKVLEPHLKIDVEALHGIQRMQKEHMKRAETILAHQKTLKVRFADLSDNDTIRKIWQHCLPGLVPNFRRLSILQGLNVQTDLEPALKKWGLI